MIAIILTICLLYFCYHNARIKIQPKSKNMLFGRRDTMVDVRVVAQYLLSKESMSHKKLEKLCYYAQAWYLANYGNPLMPNMFEAWVHGPVSPDLYSQYRGWGWSNIPMQKDNTIEFAPCELELINKVYDTYGSYTADELEALTHKEEPWLNARRGCSPSEYSRNPISMIKMRDYYGERIGKSYAK